MAARGQRSAQRTRDGAVELGPARLGEARALAAISRSYIEHGLEWRWRTDSIAAGIRAEDTRVVVARRGAREGARESARESAREGARLPVGFAMMGFDFAARSAHLQLLAVVPSHRRQGIATRLVAWLEVIAKRGGVLRLELEVREREAPARALYRRLGFREVARLPGYYQGREDALRLSRAL